MRLLAFDTSTEWCSAALWLDGQVWERAEHVGQRHSQVLLPMITDLLGEAGKELADLDGIAFGQGPGSFTGLRIACGVAQGLALGRGLSLLGVSTLEAMAETAFEETGAQRLITCLDARMNEVYVAVWQRREESWEAEHPATVRPPGAVPLPVQTGYLGCGSGFAAYPELLAERYGNRLAEVRPQVIPHARAIVRLALPRFRAGEAVPPEQAEPFYVRDKVALTIRERA